MMSEIFKFKRFTIDQTLCAMKVGTDGVLLGAWAEGGGKILDIGCGTGVVSLMMAQRFSNAIITSIDIINACCIQTRQNADNSSWGDRILVEPLSLQDFLTKRLVNNNLDSSDLFDAIVSNPPFFVDSLRNPDRNKSIARHADTLPFDVMTKCVRRLLKEGGLFSVILADECCDKFISEAWFAEMYLIETINIITKNGKKVKRRLLKFSTHRTINSNETTVVLLNDDGTRSNWFQTLTCDFYL